MSQNRRVKIIIVLALLFSSLSLGISYGSLNIINKENGVATVLDKHFDVQLEGLKNIKVTEKSMFSVEPEIKSNKLDFGISLTDKDEVGKCSFNIVNKGNIAAIVKEIRIKGLDDYKNNVVYNVEGIKIGDVVNVKSDPIMVNVSVKYIDPIVVENGGYYNEYGAYEKVYETKAINLDNVELEIIFE